jgi:hypothetical protein
MKSARKVIQAEAFFTWMRQRRTTLSYTYV